MRRGRAGGSWLQDAGICDGELEAWTGGSDHFLDTCSWYRQRMCGGQGWGWERRRVREMAGVAPRYGPEPKRPGV